MYFYMHVINKILTNKKSLAKMGIMKYLISAFKSTLNKR